jgi:hypothetical protein
VLAAIRVMNRLELVTETLRAALNELATVAPAWLQGLAPLAWYARYSKRIEDTRLPQGQGKRDAYAQTVGEDGFYLLDMLDAPETPKGLRELAMIATLRQTWQRHYERSTGEEPPVGQPAVSRVRFKANRELPPAAVAYPLAAANISRPLVSRLKSLHQPVVRARIRLERFVHASLPACRHAYLPPFADHLPGQTVTGLGGAATAAL